MSFCDGLINQGIEPGCDDIVVMGIEANGVIINRSDIDFSSVTPEPDTGTDPNVIPGRKNVFKDFTLKSQKKGFPIYVPTKQPFNGTATNLEEGTNRNSFTNTLGFVILDNGPDVCDKIIDGLANGEFVVIFENKFKNVNKEGTPGDSTFQIMGWYQGLKATELSCDKYSEDTEGGWNVVLTESRSPKSGLFLFNTDIETTRTQIQTLLS